MNNSSRRSQLFRAAWLLPVWLLCVVLLPAVAHAQFTFVTNNGAITITGYTGSDGEVIIPDTTNGYPVTSIGDSAFSGKTKLTSVTISDNITNIGMYAFGGCFGLTNVTIGNNVHSIGSSAFSVCDSLTTVVFPDSVTSIGSDAFYGFSYREYYFKGNAPSLDGHLTTSANGIVYYLLGTTGWGTTFGGFPTALWYLPVPFTYTTNNGAITITGYTGADGVVPIPSRISVPGETDFLPVRIIGANAFAGCPILITVLIPNTVTNIGSYAFSDCTNLLGAFFGGNAPSADSTVFLNDNHAFAFCLPGTGGWSSTFGGIPVMLPPYAYAITNGTITIQAFTGPGGALNIPGALGGLPITSIADEAFCNCDSLTSVTIPNSVTNLGHGAFAFCGNLTNATVPDNLIKIGIYAFWNCTNLASVTIGSNAASIGISEFDSCTSLSSLTLPGGVITIGSSAFQNCAGLGSVAIPAGVASIGRYAFADCSNLTAIEVDPLNFYYGSMDGVLVNKSQNMLVQCPGGKAGSYSVPGSITNIGNSAFDSCANLTSIMIPGAVASIGDWAFDSCSRLTSLTIPDSVTNIGYHVFDGCTSLTDVIIGSGLSSYPARIGSLNFFDCPGLTFIYLSDSSPYFVWNPTNEMTTPTAYCLPTAQLPFSYGTNNVKGVPTALWRPRVQTRDASFGVQTNQFGFNITWASGRTVWVAACTNLINPTWSPVGASITITNGSSYFSDPQWTNYPNRFYGLSW